MHRVWTHTPTIAYVWALGGRLNPQINLVFNSVNKSDRAWGVGQVKIGGNGWPNSQSLASPVVRNPPTSLGILASSHLSRTQDLFNKELFLTVQEEVMR